LFAQPFDGQRVERREEDGHEEPDAGGEHERNDLGEPSKHSVNPQKK
jgi:hypothetical protein